MKGTVAAGILIAVAVGLAAGLGGYTFVYARGASYMTNDPRACANWKHCSESPWSSGPGAWFDSPHLARRLPIRPY